MMHLGQEPSKPISGKSPRSPSRPPASGSACGLRHTITRVSRDFLVLDRVVATQRYVVQNAIKRLVYDMIKADAALDTHRGRRAYQQGQNMANTLEPGEVKLGRYNLVRYTTSDRQPWEVYHASFVPTNQPPDFVVDSLETAWDDDYLPDYRVRVVALRDNLEIPLAAANCCSRYRNADLAHKAHLKAVRELERAANPEGK